MDENKINSFLNHSASTELLPGDFLKIDTKKMIVAQLIGISLGLITPAKFGESYKILALGKEKESKKRSIGF